MDLKKYQKRLRWSKRGRFSTTRIIAQGFLTLIALGTLLLMLPVSTANGQWASFLDALFTATTASCVTGLVTVTTAEYWSTFGHVVILILIQLGGLGVVTFTTTVLLVMGKKIGIRERLLLQDAYNMDTLSGLLKMTMKILKGTFFVEGIGALLYATQMIPAYGFLKGLWFSVFHAVSAFCNAGIDILGTNSLADYIGNPVINFTTMMLIIMGGLGFVVWWDLLRVRRVKKQEHLPLGHAATKLTLQSKIVIWMTILLITVGTVIIFILEYHNSATLGNLPLGEKIMGALFQSVTLRTAGFQTISQELMTTGSQFISLILMFIGGSPGGTAGGVKTLTVGLVYIAAKSMVSGKRDPEAFRRRIDSGLILKALAVVALGIFTMVLATLLLSFAQPGASLIEVLYESTSAAATVGLTMGFTTSLSALGKLVIIVTMYIGRIGPITLALAFNANHGKGDPVIRLPEEKVMVG